MNKQNQATDKQSVRTITVNRIAFYVIVFLIFVMAFEPAVALISGFIDGFNDAQG